VAIKGKIWNFSIQCPVQHITQGVFTVAKISFPFTALKKWLIRIFVLIAVVVLLCRFWGTSEKDNQKPEKQEQTQQQQQQQQPVANSAPSKQTSAQAQAPVPRPAPAAPQPPAAPPAKSPPPTPVTTEELLRDLAEADGILAREAALRLIQRPEAMEQLVRMYGSGDAKVKARVIWCVRNLGEPGRLWLVDVVINSNNYRPVTVNLVKEILGLNGGGQMSEPPQVQPQQQPEPKAAQPKVNKDNWEKRIRLQEQFKAKQRELSRAEARVDRYIDTTPKYGNRDGVAFLRELKTLVSELRDMTAALSDELNGSDESAK